MQKLHHALEELGLQKNEIIVYEAVTKLGEAKAAAIALKANLNRTTVISILERLEEAGFITTHKYKGTCYYWAESLNVLKSSYENKIAVVDDLNHLLTTLYRSETSIPSVKTFDTRLTVRQFIEKEIAKLEKGSTIYTIDSPKVGNYEKVFSHEYFFALLTLKQKRSISTQTLVPAGSMEGVDEEKLKKQNISIRELPEPIHFQASLWIMGEKLYLFSGTPPFVTMVRQDPIVKSMTSLYRYLWSVSKEYYR